MLPTVVELTGARLPEGVQGESLVELLETGRAPERDTAFVVGPPPRLAASWRRGAAKYIRTPRAAAASRPHRPVHQLFDLSRDPGERQNRGPREPERVGSLGRELDARLSRSRSLHSQLLAGEADSNLELPEAEAERLRGLGYLD